MTSPRRSLRLNLARSPYLDQGAGSSFITHFESSEKTEEVRNMHKCSNRLTSTPFSHGPQPKFAANDSGISFGSPNSDASLLASPEVEKNFLPLSFCVKPGYFDFVCQSYESEILSLPKAKFISESELHEFSNYNSIEDLSASYEPSQTSDYFSRDSSNDDFPSFVSSSLDLDFHPDLQNSTAEIEFEKVITQFCLCDPQRTIGRKIGCSAIDYVTKLHTRNIVCALDLILSFLDGKTLSRMKEVNKSWRTIVQHSHIAEQKLQELKFENVKTVTAEEDRMKENSRKGSTNINRVPLATSAISINLNHCMTTKSPVQNATPKKKSVSKSSEPYWKAAKDLRNDQSLRKCPRCSSPAQADTVQERATCCLDSCGFDFCISCLKAFHQSRSCKSALSSQSSKLHVSSRKSRRNLKRL